MRFLSQFNNVLVYVLLGAGFVKLMLNLWIDAAIIFAPAGDLVPVALAAVAPGGAVVCAGIHMSDIPSFPYGLLWGERVLRSVANLTRQDGEEFLTLAPSIPVHTEVEVFPLGQANEALARLRAGSVRGAAVLEVGGSPD